MVNLGYLLFSLLLSVAAAHSQPGKGRCRCVYGDDCWPSSDAFDALADRLSQPLLRPLPPPSPCYSWIPEDGDACNEVKQQNFNATWRSDHPGAMQNVNFEAYIFSNGTIDACPLNGTPGMVCGQGSVPPIGVDARNPEDIQAAIEFANEHYLRIVVKNTGHDYLGRSAARGAFLIWTHHMKEIEYHDAFVPSGSPNSTEQYQAITLGAGVQWAEAYQAVNEAGRTLVGGISIGGSVGAAGGWVMGGGHSALSPTYGLGVDNVLEFGVVTAEGSHVIANAYQNPSLFWALRGGGGGTYGIVTSATYKTHPISPVVTAYLQMNITSPEIAQEVITEYVRLHPTLTDQGWGGYSQVLPNHLFFIYLSPNKSVDDGNAAFNTFFELARERSNGTALAGVVPYDSFWSWFSSSFEENAGSQVGGRPEISSRLLSREAVENDPEMVARLMLSVPNGSGVPWNIVAGGAVSQVDPESTGLNPAWRQAVAQIYVGEGWGDGYNLEEIERARERLKNGTDILDPISVDSAAYLNEAMLWEEDFKKSFFGSHYDRLKAIKVEYDPDSLFLVPLGVGSEDWDKDLVCQLD
ncbi:FAD binding domain-containing protein [Coprinopsis cinerea okayama7|uniref:FAD binding domain-containing protein n=1 Tax=Coprinopsis cinerea (strain Okayama-7 / 130 / ATCC MYA-4618 / FGSC 9003) TaxID=240176 RepID=A8P8V7_COPC7|nr:FAD binding domain-containing protein [Coprinopsis cinerea okayama7\|eukprot:XP_001839644.2 FAD binding domain-containing protein [Coprinopsis cinerea okayama7\